MKPIISILLLALSFSANAGYQLWQYAGTGDMSAWVEGSGNVHYGYTQVDDDYLMVAFDPSDNKWYILFQFTDERKIRRQTKPAFYVRTTDSTKGKGGFFDTDRNIDHSARVFLHSETVSLTIARLSDDDILEMRNERDLGAVYWMGGIASYGFPGGQLKTVIDRILAETGTTLIAGTKLEPSIEWLAIERAKKEKAEQAERKKAQLKAQQEAQLKAQQDAAKYDSAKVKIRDFNYPNAGCGSPSKISVGASDSRVKKANRRNENWYDCMDDAWEDDERAFKRLIDNLSDVGGRWEWKDRSAGTYTYYIQNGCENCLQALSQIQAEINPRHENRMHATRALSDWIDNRNSDQQSKNSSDEMWNGINEALERSQREMDEMNRQRQQWNNNQIYITPGFY